MKIFLTGFMGAGKTFTGKRLAHLLGFSFLDLDDFICEKEKKSIPEIFNQQGESSFRLIEHRYLLQTLELSEAVIATGGGTPCFNNNMDWMNDNGITIYLQVPVEVLVRRLMLDEISRPVLREIGDDPLPEKIQHLLEQRKRFYEMAHLTYFLKTGDEEIAGELATYLQRMMPKLS